LAVANVGSATVSILLGRGDGTFQQHVDYPAGIGPDSVAVGDFNRDGKSDLVTANQFNFVSVLLGNGDGTFQAHVEYGTGTFAVSAAVGDFNGDGKPDVVVADAQSRTVSVLLGNGDGTFQAHADYGTGSMPESVAVGGFNRDRAPDLAVANLSSDTVSVLLNTGGTFVRLTSSPNPSTLGEPVTFTVLVTPSLSVFNQPTPSGTITFWDGRSVLGTAPLVNGQAGLTTTDLGAGEHPIRAYYSGNSTFNPNNPRAIIQKVGP